MKKLSTLVASADRRAWRTFLVFVAVMGGVLGLIVLAKTGVIGLSGSTAEQLAALRRGPWGLPATVLVFCLTAYLAAPQFLLVAACVVAFGPGLGFLYAMIGTIASGITTFYTGRIAGASLLRRYGGDGVNRLSKFIGRNDFWASLLVRNVPTGPAIVVNMAFGVSHANFWRYLAGLTLGSIPKTAIVALLGQSVMSAMGGTLIVATLALSIGLAIWAAVAAATRKAVAREAVRADLPLPDAADPVGAGPHASSARAVSARPDLDAGR